MNFLCPNPECRAKLKARPEQTGKHFRCPRCHTAVTVPAMEQASNGLSRAMTVEKSRTEPATPPKAETNDKRAAQEPSFAVHWLFDDFVMEKHLGRGGMGDVYLVKSESTGNRFAAKFVLSELLREDRYRKLFLGELRNWIDLPEHPNLAACRFFRSNEGQVVVFAEYVDGGSLEEWIRDGKLTSLDQILDVAIQFAWGIEVVHARGLVHQDIKPANVLMTPEGVPKVTDFGLAKTRAAIEAFGGESASPSLQRDVTGTAGTPAYCSPEQAHGERLTNKTDIWSWGLSVLATFLGRRTWSAGAGALQVLQMNWKAASQGDKTAFRVPLPRSVANVLLRCFRPDPKDRWPSISQAADALIAAYKSEIRTAYPRQHPTPTASASVAATAAHDRRTTSGETWTDPHEWLRRALEVAGRAPAEADCIERRRSGSRQAQAIDDLIVYEEALSIFNRLVSSGRKDLENDVADLCCSKALVHGATGDVPGEISMLDRAIQIRETLVNRDQRPELADELASTYMHKATVLHISGDNQGAIALNDRAMEIWEAMVKQKGQQHLVERLATCYANKALNVRSLGDNQEAVPLFDRAIQIREWLVNKEGRQDLADDLAGCYMNKAAAVSALGDNRGAVDLNDRAIQLWERLVNQEGRREMSVHLARCYMNKACAVSALGDHRGAMAITDRAISIWEQLVNKEGRFELAKDLAACYLNKAYDVSDLGDNRGAVALYDRGIEVYERLVNREGRRELANDLAAFYLNKAIAMHALKDKRSAVDLFERCIEIRHRLVYEEGRRELAADLAQAQLLWADNARQIGREPEAVKVARKATRDLEAEIRRTGRGDLTTTLNWAKKTFGVLP